MRPDLRVRFPACREVAGECAQEGKLVVTRLSAIRKRLEAATPWPIDVPEQDVRDLLELAEAVKEYVAVSRVRFDRTLEALARLDAPEVEG